MKYGTLEQKRGNHVDDTIFTFPDKEYGELGWKKSGDLYINSRIRNEISYYFGLEKDDSLRVIGKWVEDRYNLKVINIRNGLWLI